MDLRDYLRVLARRWRGIMVLTLLGAALGAGATHLATPQYQASATLFVSMQAGADTTQLNQGNIFTQARVQSYAAMAASPEVTRPVVRQLRLPLTPDQLSRRITATAEPETVLLRLTVTDTRPARAANITNAISARFAEMVSSLERPDGASTSPVRLSVTEPASAPTTPHSPRPTLNLTLGLLTGLIVGAGFALAREALDTSVRTTHDLAAVVAGGSGTSGTSGAHGASVLGSIVYDPGNARHPVAAQDDVHGLRAEGFRRLRTNLRFADVDRPPRVIAVTSPLAGEGKSSVAVNLAAALAEIGASVCLVDTDLRRPSAARILGLVRDAGLTTALIGQASVGDILQSAGPFTVLTSGAVPPNPTQLLGSEQFKALMRTLAERFDHVVVDTAPALPVADTSVIAPAVDGYLLVVRAGQTRRDHVTDTLRTLDHVGARVLGAVLNMAPAKGDGATYGYAYRYRAQQRTERHPEGGGALSAHSKPAPDGAAEGTGTVKQMARR